MNQDLFDLLEHTFHADGPGAGIELLIARLREQKRYQQVFEARLLQRRHALGLPLVFAGAIADLPLEHRDAYQAAVTAAAREAGTAYLSDGDIVRAWPYFRAIGDHAPVAAAIERVESKDEADRVLGIALGEGVSVRKGFELLLEHRGICQGVDYATSCADRQNRQLCMQLLVKEFHGQLVAHVKEAIAEVEGQVPATSHLVDLIAERDWLFDGGRLYIENSHLLSILLASTDLDDPETMRLVLELAEYGQRLDPIYQSEGEAPFEEPFIDHAEYLRAVLGENVDGAVAHFQKKVAASVPGAPEVLVALLARLGRYEEAIRISVEYLDGEAVGLCPSATELCEKAGDYRQLQDLARKNGDVVGFAAGMIRELG
jgi:hypothetical protein